IDKDSTAPVEKLTARYPSCTRTNLASRFHRHCSIEMLAQPLETSGSAGNLSFGIASSGRNCSTLSIGTTNQVAEWVHQCLSHKPKNYASFLLTESSLM